MISMKYNYCVYCNDSNVPRYEKAGWLECTSRKGGCGQLEMAGKGFLSLEIRTLDPKGKNSSATRIAESDPKDKGFTIRSAIRSVDVSSSYIFLKAVFNHELLRLALVSLWISSSLWCLGEFYCCPNCKGCKTISSRLDSSGDRRIASRFYSVVWLVGSFSPSSNIVRNETCKVMIQRDRPNSSFTTIITR